MPNLASVRMGLSHWPMGGGVTATDDGDWCLPVTMAVEVVDDEDAAPADAGVDAVGGRGGSGGAGRVLTCVADPASVVAMFDCSIG